MKDSTTPENYAGGVINVVQERDTGGEMNRFIGTGSGPSCSSGMLGSTGLFYCFSDSFLFPQLLS